MNEHEKQVALDALGISAEDFDVFLADASAEVGEPVSAEELIVEMHVVNTMMMIADQTGADLDDLMDSIPDGPIGLSITLNDDGDYDITVEFSQSSDESETG